MWCMSICGFCIMCKSERRNKPKKDKFNMILSRNAKKPFGVAE